MPERKLPRIVIFGATGHLGSQMVRRFHEAGHPIVSIGRKAETLAALPGKHVQMNLAKDQNGSSFIRAHDIVINAVHVRYTSAIVQQCPNDIERIIVIGSTRYLSSIPDIAGDMVRSAARVLENGDLPWVLLHPTMIYGAARENNVLRIASLIRRFHIIPLPGGGRSLIQPIHAADVVEAVVRAAGKPGLKRAVIHLGGPDAIPYRAFLQAIAAASGSWVMVPPLPVSLLRLAAQLSAFLPGIPTIRDAEVLRLLEDKAVDVNEMKDILGFTPRPLEQGLAETFAK